MPFTLQTTAVSDVLETAAAKRSVPPSNTVPVWGVTLIVMEGGGGGGGATEPAPPPPQPRVHAPAARRTNASANPLVVDTLFVMALFVSHACGRGRMPFLFADESPYRVDRGNPPRLTFPATALIIRACHDRMRFAA